MKMSYTESQDKNYIKTKGEISTFGADKSLEKLPVPSLESSIKKYLKSIQPFVSDSEYKITENLCNAFADGEGKILQNLLLKKAEKCENWLDEWWLQKGYLQFREPLAPFLNIAGPFAANNPGGAWPVSVEKPVENVSHFIYHLMQFWKALRLEELRADKNKKGHHFSMHQFRNLFNTSRIPQKHTDKLRHFWKTESEGPSPRHAIVLRNGHAFVFNPVFKNDPKSPKRIMRILASVKEAADSLPPGHGVGALTGDFREEWAFNRQRLIDLGNSKTLELIDQALFVVVMDFNRPKDDSETCWGLMCGDPSNRWHDKSLSVIVFDNGRGGVNSDHTPMDAMVNVAMSHFIDLGVNDNPNFAEDSYDSSDDNFTRLEWLLDDSLIKAINEARLVSLEMGKKLVLKRKAFMNFGKSRITELRVNPDTFVQMAIQLAYIRLHKKPAPTYETATTRQFLKGRTETLRSCTRELVEFCTLFDDPSQTKGRKKSALQKAIDTHNSLMTESKNGQGCDRHLFGLMSIAEEHNLPIPKLFSDNSYTASGGGGNFILSTSTCGYTGMSGGTSPMCLDGYGCFYNFEPHRIWLWVTAFRHSFETSVEKFTRGLEQSLLDLQDLLSASKL